MGKSIEKMEKTRHVSKNDILLILQEIKKDINKEFEKQLEQHERIVKKYNKSYGRDLLRRCQEDQIREICGVVQGIGKIRKIIERRIEMCYKPL